MPHLLVLASFMAGIIGLSILPAPAEAHDPRTVSNLRAGSSVHYHKHWRKRAKRRYRKSRRGRAYRRHRESRDYLVTFPHTRVHLGTNM